MAFNRYATDTDEELDLVRLHCADLGVGFAINNAFNEGGKGAAELAQLVADTIEQKPSAPLRFTYEETDGIRTKIEKICKGIYGADGVTFSPAALRKLKAAEETEVSHFPVCMAKTQFSFTADQTVYGCPTGFSINIRDIVVNYGAEMVVAIAGDIMRMPGLPKSPQAECIDIVNGEIEGLS